MQATKLILIALGLLVAACSSEDSASGPGQDSQLQQDPQGGNAQAESVGEENLSFEDGDLSSPEEDGVAAAENISFSDGFQNSPSESISVSPIVIPETDFSQVSTETEPNEDAAAASILSTVSSGDNGPQFAAQGMLSGQDTDYFSFRVEGEAQLYLIEAIGPGVHGLTLFGAAGDIATGYKLKGWVGESITNIYLAP